jgi:DNA polymerase I-like protein with 3'-5' exonuclease and polymerase domains
MQFPLFVPTTTWAPPRVSDLPSWQGARRVAIDCETNDKYLKQLGPGVRRGAYIAGVSFAIEDGPAHYLPIRHEGGDNLPLHQVLGYLRLQAGNYTGEIVGANLSYDLDFLAEERITFPLIKFFRDVQVAEPLLNELKLVYSLESIAQEYLGVGKDEALLREAAATYRIDPKKDMWKLPARYVGAYAEADCTLPLRIIKLQEAKIEEQGLQRVYDLESKVLPCLVNLRRRGVRVNTDKLQQVSDFCLDKENEFLAIVKRETGYTIEPKDVMNSDLVGKALLCIGMTVPRNKKGGLSVDKVVLASVKHPVTAALQEARSYNKIRTTFVASVQDHMTNGRIHCTFNQLRKQKDENSDKEGDTAGAAYGRLSSEHTNMQQQPARHPVLGKRWRGIYEPDEGKIWASMDYSQQEPRLLTHFAEICNLPKAFEAAEEYRTNPKADNHDMMTKLIHGPARVSEMSKEEFKYYRGGAKIIFLGACYGMGGLKMCKDLGLPTEWVELRNGKRIEVAGPEGKKLMEGFDNGVPFVKKLAERCDKTAAGRGYILTLSGRRCRFPLKDDGTYDWTHKALNRLIQGSAADQTKTAMVMAEEAGHELQLQVHDEMTASVESKEQAEAIADIMRNCIKLNIPSRVDVETGPSWGESM